MQSIPFITVVIPVFNGERYIADAIDSVLRQTCGMYEIIVADDGSTDQTCSVVQRYGPIVRYEYQQNAGPAAARNRGIGLAKGDFVAFLNADDLWHPRKCAIQIARLSEQSSLVGCAAHVENFIADDADIGIGARINPFIRQTLVTHGSTLLVRRSLFDAVGALNTEYRHRDLQDLLVRAEDLGLRTEILPDVLAQRRIHSSNRSQSRSGADQMELIAITRARHARRRTAGA